MFFCDITLDSTQNPFENILDINIENFELGIYSSSIELSSI